MQPDRVIYRVERDAQRALEPGWRARLVARLRGRSLDRALLAGVDPGASAPLAARAGRLTSTSSRTILAAGLARVLASVDVRSLGNRVRPAPRSVRANENELRALTELLLGTAPVYARGVAMVRALLTDGSSPVYTDRSGDALAAALAAAHAGLAGG
jgi:hypothetical protein